MQTLRISVAVVLAAAVIAGFVACGGGTTKATPTPRATSTPKAVATATSEAVPLPPTDTPQSPTSTPAAVVDPCTLFDSLEGQPLSGGPSFTLNVDVKWQVCVGGAAAGSTEKYLFRTGDAGASWTLISETTLGNPTPQAGVGQLPNAGSAVQVLFLDETHGWLGLNGPGLNLWRSQDGGVTWASVSAIPPAVPVDHITFTDSQHGTVMTPDGNYTTSDGGITWTPP